MKNKKLMFWMIIALVIAAAVVIIKKPTKLGLDLVGGSRIVLEAQTTDTIAKITPDMMSSLQFAIENRVNALGVAETVVQQTGEKRLLVEIPNISDPAKAKEFLGETAELEFKKPLDNQYGATGWAPTGLTGKDVKKALISTNPGGQWVVSLEFNDKGTKKFGQLTQELVGKPMAIFFNGDMQSAPVIQEPILGGHAQISGGDSGFAYEEAKKMVDLLNAGALPVPAKIIEESLVGPTLGADSIAKSKTAGIVGIGLVMIFMLLYYRLPGAIADVALIIYSLLVFAVFKIVPVTLTLAGIAGFILSIGMAVDANILIFERTKEELKAGRTLFTAINAGFDRAFTSIFDSNMTTIITCVILYFLGTSIIKGFALTLIIGVLISMFTAITVTKNFMHLLFGAGQLKHPSWFGIKQSEIGKAYEATETKKEKAKFGILD
ncbi:MAG TPA: protein translocase subunit SecD [Candidatus Limenecus avicola]|uniref:Protein translocase subunit SecD n=1 Tax=Candidatus Limenecus avicola TaxID=2840847 RepID=A0A9D1MZ02_9CLOT|nr:protein translocase subunit SecD [Candidatus Limenecus avicola]